MAKALTSIAIDKLKPTAARREIPDAVMPGLYLIIQPSGAKSWAVRYRLAGVSRKFTIGPYPAFDLVKARKEASSALQAAARGEDPGIARREARDAARRKLASLREAERDTFPAVVQSFVVWGAESKKNRSWREAGRLLGVRPNRENPSEFEAIPGGLAKRWENRKIADITKRDIRDVVEEIERTGKGPLANRTFSQLRRLFNWSVERDVIATSPCVSLKAPASEDSRTRILSDDEIRWFWSAASEQSFPFGPFAKLLLLTGQRRSEVAGMRDAELDLRSSQWLIPTERSKNKRANLVPLCAEALEIVNVVPRVAGDGHVFSQTGTTPISGFSRAKKALDKLMLGAARKDAREPQKIKIEQWTYHDLRRTVASGLASLKVAPHVIEAILNHKSGIISGVAATYNVYQYADEKRDALDRWACRIDQIVTGKSMTTVVAFPRQGAQ